MQMPVSGIDVIFGEDDVFGLPYLINENIHLRTASRSSHLNCLLFYTVTDSMSDLTGDEGKPRVILEKRYHIMSFAARWLGG